MKLIDMIITILVKKGVMYEARNTVLEAELPDSKIKVKVTIDHMTVKLEKEIEA